MLLACTLLFTTLLGNLALSLQWVAKIQIIPLALAGSFSGIMLWLAITLIFGRIYCSSVCPMGVVQDCFAHLKRFNRKHRFRYGYSFESAKNRFRYTWLIIVMGCSVAGISVALTLFDPYSAFGRICSELLLPVAEFLFGTPVLVASWLAFGIAALTLILVAAFSWNHGRIICNTICPVGNTLSVISRYSMLHFDIDTDMCVNCGMCARVCKSKCIDVKDHVVDSSRCVVCFNCVDTCNEGAIRYTFRRKRLSIPLMQRVKSVAPAAINAPDASQQLHTIGPRKVEQQKDEKWNVEQQRIEQQMIEQQRADQHSVGPQSVGHQSIGQQRAEKFRIDRRQFLATGLIVASVPLISAVDKKAKRIKAITAKRKPIEGLRPVVPPGRTSVATFLDKCTGCGLCVAHCPAKVLRPAAGALGWTNMLHPVLNLDASYCRYNCTRCTDLCPTGALLPITQAEKHTFVIGKATTEPANCIGCGLCAARCPRNAIEMRARPATTPGPSIFIPIVDTSACIGCGACQYICPATPAKAIGVNGTL